VTIAYRPPPPSTMNRNETIALRFRRKGTVDWVQETVDKPSAAALYPSTRPLALVTHLDFYFYYFRRSRRYYCCCRHYVLLYNTYYTSTTIKYVPNPADISIYYITLVYSHVYVYAPVEYIHNIITYEGCWGGESVA